MDFSRYLIRTLLGIINFERITNKDSFREVCQVLRTVWGDWGIEILMEDHRFRILPFRDQYEKIWTETPENKRQNMNTFMYWAQIDNNIAFTELYQSHVVMEYDSINKEWVFEHLKNQENALNYALHVVLNVDKTMEWAKKNEKGIVFKRNGKLYWNWMNYNETSDNYLLFPPEQYTTEKPRNIRQLRNYLLDGNEIVVNWADRAPFTLQVLPFVLTQIKFDEMNKY